MLDTSTQDVCVGSYHLDREVQRTRCLEAVFRAKGALLNSPQRMNTERLRCFMLTNLLLSCAPAFWSTTLAPALCVLTIISE